MTATVSDAKAKFARAVEDMHLTGRRLRHELDRVVTECGAEGLLHPESRETSQVLVSTSGLLMVLQADISHVLEARLVASDCMLAEARSVLEDLRALTAGRDGEQAALRKSKS